MPGVETHRGWAMGKGQEMAHPYLAALTSDTAVVITGRLVPTHDTLLVFVQVTRDIPWEGGKGGGSGHGAEPSGGTPILHPPNFAFLIFLLGQLH